MDSQKPHYTESLVVAAAPGPTFAAPKPVQNSKHSRVVRRMLRGQNKTAPKQTLVLKIQTLCFSKNWLIYCILINCNMFLHI